MRRWRWVAAGGVVLAVAVGGVVAASGRGAEAPAAQESVQTAAVTRGDLSSLVSANGTLTHRARPDGSPYAVLSRSAGTYTQLPAVGDQVACGGVLLRVDDRPVLLLCGAVPAYRDLALGDDGEDVRQLNRNLHQLGYDAKAGIALDPAYDGFRGETEKALAALQRERGVEPTGSLALADAVFLPEPVRIASVGVALGAPAQPGTTVAEATSSALEVHLDLDPSQRGAVAVGDAARVTLPGGRTATGTVARIGDVVAGPPGPDGRPGAPTIPVAVGLDDAGAAQGLEEVPVRVDVTTTGVVDALSVPVTALVGRAGGGDGGRGRPAGRAPRAGHRAGRPLRHHGRPGPGPGRAGRGRPGRRPVAVSDPVLELDGVSKVYGEDPPVAALRDVSFAVGGGELVAIVGPSGSGKSTLLHVMGTLERPTAGIVRIDGIDAAQLSDRDVSHLRASRIGFVFQQFFLAEHATVRENVADGLLYAGVPADERGRLADEALERVGLADRAGFRPTKLSGGQRQRVAIARAVVGRPAIVLADEPTGNLDSATGASIMALLHELHADGATILMITHDAALADQLPRQVRLLDGRVVADTGGST